MSSVLQPMGAAGPSLLEAIGSAVVYFAWQGAVLGLLVALAMRLVPKDEPAPRCAVGVFALAFSLVSFLGTICLALRHGPLVHAQASAASARPSEASLESIVAAVDSGGSAFGAVDAFAALWLLGACAMLVRLCRGCAWVSRVRRSEVELPDARLQQLVSELCAQFRLRRPLRVMASEAVDSPAILGWLRPIVVVPVAAWTGLTVEQWRCVLAHEIAHVQRRDHWINLLLAVCEVVLFFHPAVWWIAGIVRREREHCCDDAAVASRTDARDLAEALTALESLRGDISPSAPLAAHAHGGVLLARITRILTMNADSQRRPLSHTTDHRTTGWRRARLAAALITLVVGGLLVRAAEATAATPATPVTFELGEDAEAEYAIIERRVLAAVDAELLSGREAARTLGAIRLLMARSAPRQAPAPRGVSIETIHEVPIEEYVRLRDVTRAPRVIERQPIREQAPRESVASEAVIRETVSRRRAAVDSLRALGYVAEEADEQSSEITEQPSVDVPDTKTPAASDLMVVPIIEDYSRVKLQLVPQREVDGLEEAQSDTRAQLEELEGRIQRYLELQRSARRSPILEVDPATARRDRLIEERVRREPRGGR